MSDYRTEKDSLGSIEIENVHYYGIHTKRSLDNFKLDYKKTNIKLIHSLVTVKKAAAIANTKLNYLPKDKGNAIIEGCDYILTGKYNDNFITDALQGGAGTSTNMNVNEVISNVSLELFGYKKGDYEKINPLNDVNMHQSTNDVYLTALRIASINLLRPLSDKFASLQEALQQKENDFSHIIKLGRTQLMDGVPMMAGQGFGAYARAIARDRWRLYKVEERLREINLGGTAIGTGLNAPIKYTYYVTEILRELTGLGLSRSDFLMDNTQNMDVFVEVSGLLKAAAVNLIKISNDLRILNSGPKGGFGEIKLEPLQAGSSIMPGKVNPIIPEMVTQVCYKVIANDGAITACSYSGVLELNAFAPLIADSLLESLELLTNAVEIFEEKCISTLKVNEETCRKNLEKSTALVTALVNHIGYDKASDIAKNALNNNNTIKEELLKENLLSEEEINKILNPYEVTKPGIPNLK